jgi:hypothetical protein
MKQYLFSPTDAEEERRRALAKIYSLLIRLAEEFEELSKEEATENPELLKLNIPSEV